MRRIQTQETNKSVLSFFIVKAEYVKKASQRCSFATIMEAQRYSYLYDMGQIY